MSWSCVSLLSLYLSSGLSSGLSSPDTYVVAKLPSLSDGGGDKAEFSRSFLPVQLQQTSRTMPTHRDPFPTAPTISGNVATC